MPNRRASPLPPWLLGRLTEMRLSDSLIGDLLEEHHHGRSAWWVWLQVVTAIFIRACEDARIHTPVAVSGALTGLALLWCFAACAAVVLNNLALPHEAVRPWPHGLLLLGLGLVYTGVAGALVGHVHRQHRLAALLGFLVSFLTLCLVECPLLYVFAPSAVPVTIVPLLPIALMATMVGAPLAILAGGLWQLKGHTP